MEGWDRKKLSAICEFKSGTTIDKKIEKNEGEVIYAKVGDMNLTGNEEFITLSSRYVDLESINKNQIIPVGSIIFPKRGGAIATNKKRRIIAPTIVDLNTMALVPSKIIDKDYLFFWFQQIDLADLSNGTSIPQINNYSFDDVFISYPRSIPEQQRIVSILDEAFTAIATAKANAEQNLKNAKELFESYLQGVFENKGEGWEEKRFEELCKLTRGHNPPKSKFISEHKEGYVRFYQIRDGWADDHAVYVPKTPQLHLVEPDEILMVAYRHIGKVFRGVSGAFNVALCKISNKDRSKLDDDYLFYIIPTDVVKGELMKRSERSLIPSMSVEHLKEIIIPLPPLKEQKKIVRKLDALSIETKRLEAIYQQKITDLEELKKTILQKAFNGELSSPNGA